MDKFKVTGMVAGVKRYEQVFEAKDRKHAAKLAVADGMDRKGISVQRLGGQPELPAEASPPIPNDPPRAPRAREPASSEASLLGALRAIEARLESMESRMPMPRLSSSRRAANILLSVIAIPVGLVILIVILNIAADIVGGLPVSLVGR